MMLVADRAPPDLAVVKLYAIVETESMIYIVMELAAGGELFEHIVEAGSYDEAKTRMVIRQLLEALRHLHTIGITHHDIKPENFIGLVLVSIQLQLRQVAVRLVVVRRRSHRR